MNDPDSGGAPIPRIRHRYRTQRPRDQEKGWQSVVVSYAPTLVGDKPLPTGYGTLPGVATDPLPQLRRGTIEFCILALLRDEPAMALS